MGIGDNTPQKGYCIYAHLNPINDHVYIGISKDVKKRWGNKEKGYVHCDKIYNAFKKYGWDGFYHIVMCDGLTKEEACAKEKTWISLYKLAGMSYNITDGGEGTSGIERSEAYRQMHRERMTGRYVSPETRAKLSKTHRELHLTGKKVYAFDVETKELVKQYPTIGDAALDVGVSNSCIHKAAKEIRPSSGGYIWSFSSTIDKDNPRYSSIGKNNQKIYCYDLHGNFIKMYESSREAASAVEGLQRGINACCSGKLPSYHHYIWRKELCEIEPEVLKKIRFKRHEVNNCGELRPSSGT